MAITNDNLISLTELSLVSAYEEINRIPFEKCQVSWFGDYGIHEPSLYFNEEKFNETLNTVLVHLNITREQLNAEYADSGSSVFKKMLQDISPSGKPEAVSTNYNKRLYEKVQNEYNEFIAQLKQMPPEEIIEYSYQKVIKEDIVCIIENDDLSPHKAKALLQLRNTLQDLYDEWLSTDYSQMEALRDVVAQRAESALKESRRVQRDVK